MRGSTVYPSVTNCGWGFIREYGLEALQEVFRFLSENTDFAKALVGRGNTADLVCYPMLG